MVVANKMHHGSYTLYAGMSVHYVFAPLRSRQVSMQPLLRVLKVRSPTVEFRESLWRLDWLCKSSQTVPVELQ